MGLSAEAPSTRLRVLVVEDSPIIFRLLRGLLDAYPALQCIGQSKSADSAIRDIDALRPHAVILDLSLTESSGFDVLDALAPRPRIERPIVAVLTNYATASYRQRALRLEADYFFDKSSDIVRMLRTLDSEAQVRSTASRVANPPRGRV